MAGESGWRGFLSCYEIISKSCERARPALSAGSTSGLLCRELVRRSEATVGRERGTSTTIGRFMPSWSIGVARPLPVRCE